MSLRIFLALLLVAAASVIFWIASFPKAPVGPSVPTPDPAAEAQREFAAVLAFESSDPDFKRKDEVLSRYDIFLGRHAASPTAAEARKRREEYLARAAAHVNPTPPPPTPLPSVVPSTIERDLSDLYLQVE